MQSTTIQLPGSGQPSRMFAFDQTGHAASRLMNLTTLNAVPTPELWFAPGPVETSVSDEITTISSEHYQLRILITPAPPQDMRALTRAAYSKLLDDLANSAHNRPIRFWNYVPEINLGDGDQEVYRQFCWGRAEAFENHQFELPAATGIGSQDGLLRICVVSTNAQGTVRHIENPRQLSAYKYPKEYGPRSPSFARATWVERDGAALLLLSGTSSIVDHKTLHSGNLDAQVSETHTNIEHLVASLPGQLGTKSLSLKPLSMRFYLREGRAFTAAQQAYAQHFTGYPGAEFFVADICRRDLCMEVEGVFSAS